MKGGKNKIFSIQIVFREVKSFIYQIFFQSKWVPLRRFSFCKMGYLLQGQCGHKLLWGSQDKVPWEFSGFESEWKHVAPHEGKAPPKITSNQPPQPQRGDYQALVHWAAPLLLQEAKQMRMKEGKPITLWDFFLFFQNVCVVYPSTQARTST